jgi:hypothetical protein
MTWHLIRWRVLAICEIVGATVGVSLTSQRDMPIDEKPGRSKIRQNLPAVAYRAKSLGISRCEGHNMPTDAQTIARIATIVELEANSFQNPPDLENRFLHRRMWYSTSLRTVALRRPIFKQKKVSATISLGLNYCSMGSSLSPFRDTVPLNKCKLLKNKKQEIF